VVVYGDRLQHKNPISKVSKNICNINVGDEYASSLQEMCGFFTIYLCHNLWN